jgi:Bacterial Ig domain
LRNDLGADGHTPKARLVEGPAHGRLVFRTDGTFHYLPRANLQGTDSFTYVANHGRGDSAPTVVRIRVESLRLERRTVVVPGDPPDQVSVRFTWTVRDARFNN